MQEVDNILRILEESKQAIEEHDTYKIKKLSDQTIHAATVYQDPDNISVAVIVYALSKIIERDKYEELPGWKTFYKSLTERITEMIRNLQKGKIEETRTCIKKINNSINEIDSQLRDYIQDVFIKSKINKASKIYEHGLSLSKTAELLGVSVWELAPYIGQSTVSESRLNQSLPVEKRIKYVEDIFK